MADRVLAHIELINDITPIKGADFIETAHVLGWQVIVRKDEELSIGNKIVYIEIDSRLPANAEWAQFLASRGFKVKTIKLRGQISQGLIFPMSILPIGDYQVGQDVSEVLGITKIKEDYVPPEVTPEQRMKSKRPDLFKKKWFKFCMQFVWFRKMAFKALFRNGPSNARKFPDKFEFVTKTDEVRIQNNPDLLKIKTPMVVTEKLEGTSTTFILERKYGHKYKFYVCSRHVCQISDQKKCWYDENVYWKMANKYNIRNKLATLMDLHPDWNYCAIQGETIGPGICHNIYELSDYDFYAYNFIDSWSGRYGSICAKNLLEGYGIKFVPILETHFMLPDTVDEMLAKADGESVIIPTMREGLVIRSADGKISFKAVSNAYLLKKAEWDDDDEEEENYVLE